MSSARRPRFLPFIVTGAVIGFLVGALLASGGWFAEPEPSTLQGTYGPSAAVGYLGLIGAGLFALLAALVALAVDWWSRRS
ncbi:hypothetical protein KC207_15485 [Phycicoccus sp. BSK3Z-2]|uniref:Uncharacterized protein n=1 Tax=Phycicoccus avicenniae TaxID=2828860 RepID=A0A941D9Q9_9MICO|nr:hypothetical protein [Phycicoccus avicenniae]MBR7744699.1 hypothetical protein [Phycicoccus avicenniae]